jgi:hypothetical protein
MIIGLTGYAGSGKDEAARGLTGFTRVAFADALRDVLYDMNPSVEYMGTEDFMPLASYVDHYGWQEAKARTEARELLQSLGVAVRTHIGEDAWVRAALRKTVEPGNYVFTDVRFPNEANAIKSFGGVIVRIERAGIGPVNGHESETAMDGYGFDEVILNNGTIDELHHCMTDRL